MLPLDNNNINGLEAAILQSKISIECKDKRGENVLVLKVDEQTLNSIANISKKIDWSLSTNKSLYLKLTNFGITQNVRNIVLALNKSDESDIKNGIECTITAVNYDDEENIKFSLLPVKEVKLYNLIPTKQSPKLLSVAKATPLYEDSEYLIQDISEQIKSLNNICNMLLNFILFSYPDIYQTALNKVMAIRKKDRMSQFCEMMFFVKSCVVSFESFNFQEYSPFASIDNDEDFDIDEITFIMKVRFSTIFSRLKPFIAEDKKVDRNHQLLLPIGDSDYIMFFQQFLILECDEILNIIINNSYKQLIDELFEVNEFSGEIVFFNPKFFKEKIDLFNNIDSQKVTRDLQYLKNIYCIKVSITKNLLNDQYSVTSITRVLIDRIMIYNGIIFTKTKPADKKLTDAKLRKVRNLFDKATNLLALDAENKKLIESKLYVYKKSLMSDEQYMYYMSFIYLKILSLEINKVSTLESILNRILDHLTQDLEKNDQVYLLENDLIGEAKYHYDNGEYKTALRITDKGLLQEPSKVSYIKLKIECLEGLGKYEEALKICNEWLSQNDKNHDMYRWFYSEKGHNLYDLNCVDEAFKTYKEVIAFNIQEGNVNDINVNLYNLAYAKQQQGKNAEALLLYNLVLMVNPEYECAIQEKKKIEQSIASGGAVVVNNEINDNSKSYLEVLKTSVTEAKLSDEARHVAEEELRTIERLGNDRDVNDHITFMNHLLKFPWGKYDQGITDLSKIEKKLNDSHYGQNEVKEKIMESLITIGNKNATRKAPILCLVGSPGVGKTSIASSIADALGRKSISMALGGLDDSMIMRGMFRSYSNSSPGKIISLISQAGVLNPVIILDEIDKTSNARGQGVEAVLLALLDPEQNSKFRDDYFNISFDLSQVMFIATANSVSNISAPLRSRMHIINLDGYSDSEKVEIAKKYLLPKILEEYGLEKSYIKMSDNVIKELITNYTRESGVRELKRYLESSIEKYELGKVRGRNSRFNVDLIEEYFGSKKKFIKQPSSGEVIGRSNGLAWTEEGGSLLPIEARIIRGFGKVKRTGSLGDVLKESIEAAYSSVVADLEEIEGEQSELYKLKNEDIHIHFPEGAVPKDGPSAGVAIYTAIMSAFAGKRVRQDVAMTGEITLHGDILPVGGIKEKLSAAVRDSIKTVIIPATNAKELELVPEEIKKALTIELVSNISELTPFVLGEEDAEYVFNRRLGMHKKVVNAKKKKPKLF